MACWLGLIVLLPVVAVGADQGQGVVITACLNRAALGQQAFRAALLLLLLLLWILSQFEDLLRAAQVRLLVL